MSHPITDPRVPEAMKKQWRSQVQLLPEERRRLFYGYLSSSYLFGLQHGYDRRDNEHPDKRAD